MKEKLNQIKNMIMTEKGKKIVLYAFLAAFVLFLVVRGTTAIYLKANSKTLRCTYESVVSDYSKLKIEETYTNVFIKNKRSKMIHEATFTVLHKDKETLESMKKDKKMFASAFDEIKGTKAKYKARGYKVSTTVTYKLAKMEKQKREELTPKYNATYEEIKAYYEKNGYTCK